MKSNLSLTPDPWAIAGAAHSGIGMWVRKGCRPWRFQTLLQENLAIKYKTRGASMKMHRHEVSSQGARESSGRGPASMQAVPKNWDKKKTTISSILAPFSQDSKSMEGATNLSTPRWFLSSLYTLAEQRLGVFQYLSISCSIRGGGWQLPSITEVLS